MTAQSGAADRSRPPGAAAAPPPIEHPFEPWTYTSGLTVCIYWDPIRRVTCNRPAEEHAEVDEDAKALDEEAIRRQGDLAT